MGVQRISTASAVPGMILAENIYTNNNILVINKDSTLTNRIIARLKFYSISELYVYEDGIKEEPKVSEPTGVSHIKQVQSTESFKKFTKKFEYIVTDMQLELNRVITHNQDINAEKLISETQNILGEGRNSTHLFDMIHSMRDYDDQTYVHSLNVSLICNIIGRWLKFSDEQNNLLTLAGMLHDIGKLMIPKEIVNKPSRLTESEYLEIQTHTVRGYNILKQQPLDHRIKYAALMHHERCDRTGYPNHLGIAEIDDFAKIVAIADVYDAMTSSRVYRGPICPFEVINIFETEGLLKYDPKFLLPFLQGVVETYLHNMVRLNNGVEGEIIMINKQTLAKPIIKVGSNFIDLSTEPNLFIESLI